MIDGDAWPIATILADCLCEQLDLADLPSTCFCGVVPGAVITEEYGSGDMAWVRLVQSYPSENFPNGVQQATCSTPLAHVFEIGVIRCSVMPSANGQTTPAQQIAAGRLQAADQQASRKAICCLPDVYDVAIQTFTPIGPTGGLVGGAWTVVVQRVD